MKKKKKRHVCRYLYIHRHTKSTINTVSQKARIASGNMECCGASLLIWNFKTPDTRNHGLFLLGFISTSLWLKAGSTRRTEGHFAWWVGDNFLLIFHSLRTYKKNYFYIVCRLICSFNCLTAPGVCSVPCAAAKPRFVGARHRSLPRECLTPSKSRSFSYNDIFPGNFPREAQKVLRWGNFSELLTCLRRDKFVFISPHPKMLLPFGRPYM